jgi:hypothetical protein
MPSSTPSAGPSSSTGLHKSGFAAAAVAAYRSNPTEAFPSNSPASPPTPSHSRAGEALLASQEATRAATV